MKICSKNLCEYNGSPQPPENFSRDKRSKSGLQAECRSCVLKYKKKKYSSLTPQEKRNRTLLKYGLSEIDYQSMLRLQKGKCKICGTKSPGKRWNTSFYVDHCHKTNKVRGLLCLRCNAGLGYFSDSSEFLKMAYHYVNQYEKDS